MHPRRESPRQSRHALKAAIRLCSVEAEKGRRLQKAGLEFEIVQASAPLLAAQPYAGIP